MVRRIRYLKLLLFFYLHFCVGNAKVFSISRNRLITPKLSAFFSSASPLQQSPSKQDSILPRFDTRKGKRFVTPVAGALAACFAELIMLPLDVAKVNTQLGRLGKKTEAGTFDILSSIVAINGYSGLWRGLPASLLKQIGYQVSKVVLFGPMTALAVLLTGAAAPSVGHMLLGGGLAGTLGAFLTTPFDRIKVRAQILSARNSDSAWEGLKQLYNDFKHLNMKNSVAIFSGATITCQRAFIVNAVELTTYNYVKGLLAHSNQTNADGSSFSNHSAVVHLIAAISAGFVAAAISAPVDRAKTLMLASPGTYSGLLDCLSDVFVKQGLVGLFRGSLVTWLRLAPFTLLFFVMFEQLKKMLLTELFNEHAS